MRRWRKRSKKIRELTCRGRAKFEGRGAQSKDREIWEGGGGVDLEVEHY